MLPKKINPYLDRFECDDVIYPSILRNHTSYLPINSPTNCYDAEIAGTKSNTEISLARIEFEKEIELTRLNTEKELQLAKINQFTAQSGQLIQGLISRPDLYEIQVERRKPRFLFPDDREIIKITSR